MKTTLLPYAATGANQISCVKISRNKRELHALSKSENADSLANLIGTVIAKGSSMKTILRKLLAAMLFLAVSLQIHAQGLIIDQESYPKPISVFTDGVDGLYLNSEPATPLTQSFIPSLSAIDYVALEFEYGTGSATVEVNLYEGSATVSAATLLGTTTAVTMPSGFNNNQLDVAGVEDFYFSTPITLTPGDTYYLEPVAVSGAANWAIVTLIDFYTYPNGELNVDGYPFVNSTDMWFQEGIVAVPEPTTLALIGFGGLLVFIFKRRSNLPMFVFASILFSVPVLTTHASDSVTKATADAAGLTPVSVSDLPATGGTYWVTVLNGNGGLTALPWPFYPTNLADPSIYSITNQIFLVDTSDGKLSTSDAPMDSEDAAATAQAQAQSMATLIENIENPPTPPGAGGDGTNGYGTPHPQGIQINPDGLYIMATNEVPDGLGGLGFLLFNPDNSLNYQLLSTTNLLNTNWCLGPVIFYPGSSGNYFNPVPMTNTMTFFRVHQADPVMVIQNYQNATEMSVSNDLGQQGYFYLYNEGGQTNDVPVYYSISGTAQNGIAYSNLTGVVIVSNNVNSAYIYVNPLTNGLQPNLDLILTLNQNTNYLIDPNYAAATNTIIANPQIYPIVKGDTVGACPNSTTPVYLQVQNPGNLTLAYTILSWPTHGTLDTNTLPYGYANYTTTGCFEGQDSFTYKVVGDGQYTAGPVTVTLDVSDPMYSGPLSVQTCRGTPVTFTLNVNDSCGETLSNYTILSTPANGTLSNWPSTLIFTFTPDGTVFTGTNIFSYIAYSDCGDDSTTNSVTITIGDQYISTTPQNLITGTNLPVAITLSASGNSDCNEDTNDFIYAITSEPTYGTLTNQSGAIITYVPPKNFEGQDSFQYIGIDGVWSNSPATVTVNVSAGPILSQNCNPFGTNVLLDWTLDTNAALMNLNIQDYIVYRSTNSDFSNYTAIATNDVNTLTYLDTNDVTDATYYYAVTFQSADSPSGLIVESPHSNEIETSAQNPDNLLSSDSDWEVETNIANTNIVTKEQAPLSSFYPGQYPGIYPPPNSHWNGGTTNLITTTFVVPTNIPLSQVQFSIAIDNEYFLYLNNTFVTNYNHSFEPVWSTFQPFPTGLLHDGTNTVHLEIVDEGAPNYFSMVITANNCGM
jgi:hypothetical protein